RRSPVGAAPARARRQRAPWSRSSARTPRRRPPRVGAPPAEDSSSPGLPRTAGPHSEHAASPPRSKIAAFPTEGDGRRAVRARPPALARSVRALHGNVGLLEAAKARRRRRRKARAMAKVLLVDDSRAL